MLVKLIVSHNTLLGTKKYLTVLRNYLTALFTNFLENFIVSLGDNSLYPRFGKIASGDMMKFSSKL